MSEKILIVDDSPSTLMLMKFSLEKKGYIVVEAASGEAAVDVLEKNPDIACLVSDINMPGMSGIDLTREVRRSNKFRFMPVIVLTNPDNPEKKQEARNAGATGWLDKPFKPENLTKVIAKISKRPAN
ncbi:MAG: response regulator [Desulfobacteraceae bacterium]|jgi:two-component system chemotaxis response regulator CheY